MSTRSNKSADAHRDFDGFDPNEELRLFREAIRDKRYGEAAVLAFNLDEWLTRGGDRPEEWLGPPCMRDAG